MKIICKKGYHAKKTLQLVTDYIEKMSLNYPLLADDIEIEISLKGMKGEECPDNKNVIYLDQKELLQDMEDDEIYYDTDALTGLYNRSKYERDISMFQTIGYNSLTCIYIDVVGLHEINNHLGHQAGDHMLCSIADGIQKYFSNSLSYRIGGDEFVVLSAEQIQSEVEDRISVLKQEMRKQEYEISVGVAESTDRKTLNDMINYAENAMRLDKANFYRNNGGARQMRSLNYKLEKLLLEKQDASHFLNVIAPRYKGVYMVNTEKDTCRYIYVPPYFQEMLDKNQGSFSRSMKDYCHTLVCSTYYNRFEKIFDYDYIWRQLADGEAVGFVYQKCDGNWIELKITSYDQDTAGGHELLWIFSDDSHLRK